MLRSASVLLALSIAAATQDVLVLKNGSDISGTIVSEEGENLVLHIEKPPGDMNFPYRDVLSINGISAIEILRVRALAEAEAAALESRADLSFGGPLSRIVRTPKQLEEAQEAEAKKAAGPPSGHLAAATRQRSLRFLGLVPEGFDLASHEASLRVAFSRARFDRSAMNLWLILDRRGSAPRSNEADWGVEWLLAGIGSSEEEFDVVHELGHYAASQLVDWEGVAKARAANADAGLAFDAMWEGVADLAALEAVLAHAGLDAARTPDARSAVAHASHLNAVPALGAPMPFRRQVFFAQEHGAAFLSTARCVRGWKVIRRALHDPPASTEQVLHPEKYFCERDLPVAVRLTRPLMGVGTFDPIDEDTLGEFGTQLALSTAMDAETAARAAAGWGGDRWQVFRSKEGVLGLVWLSVWDSEEEAKEFTGAAAKWLEKRHGGAGLTPAGDLLSGKEGDAAFFVERNADRVLVADGFPPDVREAVRKGMWASEVTRPGGSAEAWILPAEWKGPSAAPGPPLAELVKPASPAAPSGAIGAGGFACEELGFTIAASGEWQLSSPTDEERKRGVFVKAKVRLDPATAEVSVDALPKGAAPGLYFASVLKAELQLVADKKQQVVSRALATVGGHPALVWVTLPNQLVDGKQMRVKQAAIALDGRAVRVRFSAPDEAFAALAPHLDRLLAGLSAR